MVAVFCLPALLLVRKSNGIDPPEALSPTSPWPWNCGRYHIESVNIWVKVMYSNMY